MEDIRFIKLYSGIFKKHTADDAENYFILGAPQTTPDFEESAPQLPKPWLFFRVLLLSLGAFAGFYIGILYFGNQNFLPGLILFGSVTTPVSLLVFFWEINILHNISIYRLILYLVKGSVVSLLCTVTLYAIIDGELSPLLIGFIEETAKALTIIIFIGRKNYKFVLNGMLVGAAVGTGFAAFESAGYILMTALKYGLPTMLGTIFWRAVFAPGGHIAWASLMGAALLRVKGDRRLSFSVLADRRFIAMYVLVVLLHALWDTELTQPLLFNIPVLPVTLTAISWMVLYAVIKRGIKQAADAAHGGTILQD